MEILIAFDSFKGCLSSQAAGEAFARGVRSEGATCRVLTMSDGGDGMLDAFLATLGGDCITIACHDALMRRIEASYGLCGQRAIIEVAQACGLSRIELENRNPLVATSYGVGELLADAVMRGAKECVIGLGGTATSDCGIGMIRALIEHLGRSATTALTRCGISTFRICASSSPPTSRIRSVARWEQPASLPRRRGPLRLWLRSSIAEQHASPT